MELGSLELGSLELVEVTEEWIKAQKPLKTYGREQFRTKTKDIR